MNDVEVDSENSRASRPTTPLSARFTTGVRNRGCR
jgi:hypothetical protein